MKKDLKDYIHFHMGCDMVCIAGSSDYEYEGQISRNSPLLFDKHSNGKWKLVLRPLVSMTIEEAKELVGLVGGMECEINDVKKGGIRYWTEDTEVGFEYLFFSELDSERFKHLLSKDFDVFGLIDAGLAVEKKQNE